ncbi:hypothetical protein [Kutzneria buriramensis]|uniref:DUF7711 domain-containing protein n=1 Tax=Kutzneria buriramensis TaxID=1045776 RepID=A0A3E0GVN4_9PSEU|nr:hypothetical protein [Kutzneria buriramensis]REH30720.1 hypothetical protein BCF44_12379 [Kutzneria buriramensis]
MKWSRGVHHLEELARRCDTPSPVPMLPVVGLWAFGDILGEAADLDRVQVALVVDLPVADVPWLDLPRGAQHWSMAKQLKEPLIGYWRSAAGPVWNHAISRPALVWDASGGVREGTLAALREGRGAEVRADAPAAEELRAQIEAELAVSLRALRQQHRAYDDKRWRPGKLEPYADSLWRAADGYLDLLDAVRG